MVEKSQQSYHVEVTIIIDERGSRAQIRAPNLSYRQWLIVFDRLHDIQQTITKDLFLQLPPIVWN